MIMIQPTCWLLGCNGRLAFHDQGARRRSRCRSASRAGDRCDHCRGKTACCSSWTAVAKPPAARSRPRERAIRAAGPVSRCTPPAIRVRAGQPLITLHTDTPERFARAREALAERVKSAMLSPRSAR